MKCDKLNEKIQITNDTRMVYLKSEVDKVIAEMDETINELKERNDELQKATDSAWSKVNAMYDELLRQKYKRCLAMAMWCSDVRELMHKLPVTDVDADRIRMKQCKWCRKWRNRWLAIAEKFREAK